MTHERDDEALQRRLERLNRAISGRQAQRPGRREQRRAERAGGGKGRALGLLPIALAFIAAAIATGKSGLLIPGLILAAIAASRLLASALSGAPKDLTRAHVGMGAEIADTAVLEPGAVVEMGAEVKAGARVSRGAVVRMGAEVETNAVIEPHAVIGWGVDVGAGAVVGEGAVIGAGATVKPGARVPPGTRVAPGGTFAASSGAPLPVAAPAAVRDERRDRIDQACARIEAELQKLPESFREHLGATAETATSLRATCLELIEREKALRQEASAESLQFLDTERAELQRRVDASSDDQVKRSLGSAVAAIEDQQKQRLQLKTHADRLEAELTRLQWTLDGMATQLLRLRSTGVDAGKPPSSEVMQSVNQLHDEIDAIADALEHVRAADQGLIAPVSEIAGPDESLPPPSRERERG
ncbi:MAG: hypothetical protein IPJ65_09055 [Archangiaceae bacterium]|nr:hypothetical protein [Archangiaceae bacterium]